MGGFYTRTNSNDVDSVAYMERVQEEGVEMKTLLLVIGFFVWIICLGIDIKIYLDGFSKKIKDMVQRIEEEE